MKRKDHAKPAVSPQLLFEVQASVQVRAEVGSANKGKQKTETARMNVEELGMNHDWKNFGKIVVSIRGNKTPDTLNIKI